MGRILCDDSATAGNGELLARPDFEPDGFTVGERMAGTVFLDDAESDPELWLRNALRAKVDAVLSPADGRAAAAATDFCLTQLLCLLTHRVQGVAVADSLWNQELPSVVDRVVAHCLRGDVEAPVITHRHYVEAAVPVAFSLLRRVLAAGQRDLRWLLSCSLVSGLIGAEMKLRTPELNVALPVDLGTAPARIAGQLWSRFQQLARRPFLVDHWDSFAADTLNGKRHLVWFFDDYPETVFDLLFLARLAELNPRMHLTLVPKSLPCYTDADVSYLRRVIAHPTMRRAGVTTALSQAELCAVGPRMSTANIRKLSPVLARRLAKADCVFVKGTSIHEMFQGGLAKPLYTGYVLTSEFNESSAGYDRTHAPTMLLRHGPGEYAHWGFEGRQFRARSAADGRRISVCWSTLAEHLTRREQTDPARLRADRTFLDSLTHRVSARSAHALAAEKRIVSERMDAIRNAY
ncbi:ARMT1-like domain-containing protein [Pilimelia columellifera]|uniref:ARMT1-like domain-containing protein n=1 Tax=Pilimelia columellifera TaxID=706574 RepID=UPI0031E3F969